MISIIVPIYNVEKYLDECIRSILNQTYSDFELILIDDGSTDSSGLICDQWAKQYSNIKALHQCNSGVSVARNHALSIAKGEYISFIDSDDWIATDYFETLMRPIEKSNVDIVFSGIINSWLNHNEEIHLDESGLLDMNQAEHYFRTLTTQLMSSPVSKIYKKSIIDKYHIKFNETICFAEDREFNLIYTRYIKLACILSYTGYYYRRYTNNSLSKGGYSYAFDLDFQHWKMLKNNFTERQFHDIPYIDNYLVNDLYNKVNDKIVSDTKRKISFLFLFNYKNEFKLVDFDYLYKKRNQIKASLWSTELLTRQLVSILLLIYKISISKRSIK